MSLVVPPGYGLAAITFTSEVGTPPLVTTLGIDLSAAGGDFVAAANTVFTAYRDAFTNEWSTSLTLDRVTLHVGSDGPSGSVDSTISPATSTRTGAFPPVAMAVIARKQTAQLGRQGRGRMYLPGVASENEVDETGEVVAARRTALDAALQEFYDYLTPGTANQLVDVPPVLLHSVGTVPPSPITGFSCAPVVGWIRGRLR